MLRIDRLSKSYGNGTDRPITAADEVTFAVPPGRIVGFVGPNGAGKSTTMRSVMGLVAYDSGTITWNDRPVDAEILARVGYLPEQRGLYPKMKIGDQVAYFGRLKGLDGRTAHARATALLGDLGLGDRTDDLLQKLSHGNQQRVQLAVALVTEPDLLILDEPFSGLDPVAAETLEAVLLDRVRDGAAVLFSSHQLDLVERVSNELVVIVGGRIRAAGTVDGVRSERGRHRVVVRVDAPIVPLPDVLAGLPVLASTTNSAVVDVESDLQLEDVLARCRTAGPIVEARYELPPLSELFADLVQAEQVAAGEVRS